eukprot:Gb_11831 [translate_table: standard]
MPIGLYNFSRGDGHALSPTQIFAIFVRSRLLHLPVVMISLSSCKKTSRGSKRIVPINKFWNSNQASLLVVCIQKLLGDISLCCYTQRQHYQSSSSIMPAVVEPLPVRNAKGENSIWEPMVSISNNASFEKDTSSSSIMPAVVEPLPVRKVKGEKFYLGTYDTEEKAGRAYDIAAIFFKGSSAKTNYDISQYDVQRIRSSLQLKKFFLSRVKKFQGFDDSGTPEAAWLTALEAWLIS